jgi:hypothetical protein
MPSAEHESPIALAKLDPGLVAWLLANVFDVTVPEYHHARTHDSDVQILVPRTYHADGMVLFCDESDRPVLATVLEVQRRRDRAKKRTWKLYVAQLEAELDVDAALVVFCPDAKVAQWYRALFADPGLSLPLRPMIFTPADVPMILDGAQARANPALAVLSAICHGAHPEVDLLFPALTEALQTLGAARSISYYDVVLAGLPPAARARWEDFMTTTADHEYRSELFRRLAAEAEAEAKVRAVLTVLDARSVTLTDDLRKQILTCTDRDLLDDWLRRAATAATVDEVLHP